MIDGFCDKIVFDVGFSALCFGFEIGPETDEEYIRLMYGDRTKPEPQGVIVAKGCGNPHFRAMALHALRRGHDKRLHKH